MKTKQLITLSIIFNLFFFIQQSFAQNIGMNGTGANPHASALLDVDATGGPATGLLIPRIALTAINVAAPVTSPATSLLVYNTATASTGTTAVSPGYYYWDATKWVRFAYNASGSSSTAWDLLGNAGTTAGTNFLGTTDAKDLVFKTNNLEAVRITTLGDVGLGTATPSCALHVLGAGFNSRILVQNNQPALEFYDQNSTANTKRWVFWAGAQDTMVIQGLSDAGGGGGSLFYFKRTGTGIMQFNGRNGLSHWFTIDNNIQRVGIGTTTPVNKLEITHGTAGNSGLRFTNLPNASVLSTDANGDVIPATASTATNNGVFWSLAGNAGTTAGTNFVGTTDAKSLVFKTNNLEAVRITTVGNVGVNRSSPVSKLHIQQSADDLPASAIYISNVSGSANSIFGVTSDSKTYIGAQNNYDGPGSNIDDGIFIDNNAGFVGIGTSNPTQKLHIEGNNTNLLHLANTTTSHTVGAWQNFIRFSDGTVTAGYVGEASGGNRFSLVGHWNNEVSIVSFSSNINASENSSIILSNTANANPRSILFRTSNVQRAIIDDNGNMGIGTTAPTSPLQIKTHIYFGEGNGNAAVGPDIRMATAGYIASDQGMTFNINAATSSTATTASPILFTRGYGNSTSDYEMMRLTGDGSLGIGITSPQARLHVVGAPTSTSAVQIQANANYLTDFGATDSYHGVFQFLQNVPTTSLTTLGRVLRGVQGGLYTGNANEWTVGILGEKSSGPTSYNVGVYGTIAGQASANETIVAGGFFNNINPAANQWSVYASGKGYYTTSWTASDRAFKKEITPLENSLTEISKLKLYSYYFDTNHKYAKELGLPACPEKQYGVIAQELETVFPDMVTTDGLGNKLVKYDALIPVALSAIQEQQKQIENQSFKIEQQQKQIDVLIKEIQALKQK